MPTSTTIRILRVLARLDRGFKNSAAQLARLLAVTRRTVIRYRGLLRTLAKRYPEEFGPKTEAAAASPIGPPPLTSYEALALALAVQLSPLLKREDFADDIETGLAKVLAAITPEMRASIAQRAADYRKRQPARHVSHQEHQVRAALVDVATRLVGQS
jgi:hypothetical protein